MIFVSKYGGYKIVAKHEGYDRLTQTGLGGGFTCEFRPDVLEVHMELLREQMASGQLKFNGTPRSAQTNQDLDPAERCSTYDTEWVADPELRNEVEKSLLANSAFNQDYWLFDKPEVAAPWPAYDQLVPQGRRTLEMVAEKIQAMTRDAGLDPQVVAAYEREHANRPLVLQALEALTVESEPEPEEELVTA